VPAIKQRFVQTKMCVLLTDSLLQIVELAPVIFLERKEHNTCSLRTWAMCQQRTPVLLVHFVSLSTTTAHSLPFSLSVCV